MKVKTIFRILVAIALFAIVSLSAFAQSNGRVRFVHVVPNAPAVDVYINGLLALTALDYGSSSNYLIAPAGDHTVIVTATGESTALWEQTITVEQDRATTYIASEATFTAFRENLSTASFGNTRLLLVHALSGADPVDVSLAETITLNGVEQSAGTKIATGMSYNTSFGAFDLPVYNYVVNVMAGDTLLLENVALPLNSGTSYLAVVYGTPDSPQVMLLGQMTNPAQDSGLVRVVHAVLGAPAVDVYANNTLVATALEAGVATVHMSLPTGNILVEFKVAGTEDILASTEIVVDAFVPKTVVAMDATGAVALSVVTDDISAPASTATRTTFTITNAIPMSMLTELTLDGESLLSDMLPYAESAVISRDASAGELNFTIASASGDVTGTESVVFYGGAYYNLVLVAQENEAFLLSYPTAITQTVNSAPVVTDSVAVVATPEPIVTAEPVVAATPEPTAQPVVNQTTPVPAQPVVTDPKQIIATVTGMNVGVSLQLRQNPNSNAFSLGLAPNGTVLLVNGREGAPVALVEGQAPPPEADTWVDPVGLLTSEQDDLNPANTWLNVTYQTSDGGTVTAWANAQFLDVRNGRGDKVRLRDIVDLVGGNVPGRAQATTVVTPPPLPQDVLTAVVINLNVGANLNIRRFPTVDGEVLARVPNNTVLLFKGMLETDDWAFVEYTTPEGNIVTGWVSADFLRYEYNGRTFTLENFKNVVSRVTAQAMFEIIPATQGGDVRGAGGGAPVIAPTAQFDRNTYVLTILVDPTAGLNVRRYTDATSEVINRIPGGTVLATNGRDVTGGWLSVTLEGADGWVDARFVSITLNGRGIAVDEVPIASQQALP